MSRNNLAAIATKEIAQLLIIDANVENHQELTSQTLPDVESIVLDSTKDSIEQITQTLQQYSSVSTLQIISHGSPGCLYLGRNILNLGNLASYTEELQSWSVESILLYGCNVASGDAGAKFIEKLHQLTGAKIAASKTLISNAV